MSRVCTFLKFNRTAEQAFSLYKSVFDTEFNSPIMRFCDAPHHPPLSEDDKQLIQHVELVIFGNHVLMGKDEPSSLGFSTGQNNAMFINLEPDTRTETERLFNALAAGGIVETPLQDMFWGGYYCSLTDAFGVQWMLNCTAK